MNAPPSSLPTGSRTPRSVGRVALVDDDPNVLRSLQTLVTCLGYDVLCSQNPLEMFSLIEADPDALDLLITDLEMPEMHGHDLIHRVRIVRPDILVLVVTGSRPRQRIRGVSYVSKPCSSRALAVAIDELVRSPRAS